MNIRKVIILTVIMALACLVMASTSVYAYTGDVNITAAVVNDTRVDPSVPLDFTVGPIYNGTTNNPVQNGFQLDFDGVGDYVSLANDSSLHFTSDFTVMAWVTISEAQSHDTISIIGDYDGSFSGYAFYVRPSDNAVVFHVGRFSDSALSAVVSTQTLTVGTPYFVCGKYDGAAHVYVNAVSTSVGPFAPIEKENELTLIGKRQSLARYFNGSIDEPMIYNRSLGQGEIDYVYQNKVPLNQTGLVFWSDFDTNVLDQTPNGNDGTIAGDPDYIRGLRGKADLVFDGAGDYVDCGNDASIRLPGNFSIEFNGKLTTFAVSQGIFATRDSNFAKNNQYLVGLIGAALRIYQGDTILQPNVAMTPNPPLDEDHLFTVTKNGTFVQWYLDGEKRGNGTITITPTALFDELLVGASRTVNGFYNGTLDEVRIYKERVLTQTEIQQHLLGIYTDETNLTLHLDFDGDYLDGSPEGNDGTPGGDTEFSDGWAFVPVSTSILGQASLVNSSTGMMTLIQDAPATVANYTVNVYPESNSVQNATIPLFQVDLYNIDVGALYTEIEAGFQTLLYANGSSVLDGHQLTDGDSLVINGVTLTWNQYMGRFEGTTTSAIPAIITFDTLTSMLEATYAITNGNITSAPTVVWTTDKLTLLIPFMRTGDWPGAIIQINVLLMGQTVFWTFLLMTISVGVYSYAGAEVALVTWMLGWGTFASVLHAQALTISLILMAIGGGVYIAKLFLDRRTSV